MAYIFHDKWSCKSAWLSMMGFVDWNSASFLVRTLSTSSFQLLLLCHSVWTSLSPIKLKHMTWLTFITANEAKSHPKDKWPAGSATRRNNYWIPVRFSFYNLVIRYEHRTSKIHSSGIILKICQIHRRRLSLCGGWVVNLYHFYVSVNIGRMLNE